jgi:hypothetical protein
MALQIWSMPGRRSLVSKELLGVEVLATKQLVPQEDGLLKPRIRRLFS